MEKLRTDVNVLCIGWTLTEVTIREGGKKLPEMKDALKDEKKDLETREGSVGGVTGYEEWNH